MTTARRLVVNAFRESGLTQTGVEPDVDEFQEGLEKLNMLISSLFGNELGSQLTSLSYGVSSTGNSYEAYEDASPTLDSSFIPSNSRVMANLGSAKTLYLEPNPRDGARFGVVDVAGNFATRNLTVKGNGRKVEGSASLVLSANNTSKTWFYRADLGSWVLCADLQESDESPFPSEFDDFLITLLAVRLNPRYQTQTAGEIAEARGRGVRNLRSRYRQQAFVGSEDALLGPNQFYSYYPPDVRFNRGSLD